MKRFLWPFLFLPVLASCEKEPETITFWTNFTNPHISASEILIDRFHSAQDEVRVELVSFPFHNR